jgi:preprotein translocase subunit SecF
MRLFKNANYNFLRWRWHAVAFSWVLIIAGVVTIATRGLPMGIEFAGGTAVVAQFDREPSVESVREALNRNYQFGGQDAIVQSYGEEGSRQVMVRVPQVGANRALISPRSADAVEESLRRETGPRQFQTSSNARYCQPVGSVKLLARRKACRQFVLSLVGILTYIAFRFSLSFAVGPSLSRRCTTFSSRSRFLAFFQYDMTLQRHRGSLT